MRSLVLDDFSGGLRFDAPPSTMNPNELAYSCNFTLTETGKLIALPPSGMVLDGANGLLRIYYSPTLGVLFTQRGTGLYRHTYSAGSFDAAGTLTHTFTTAAVAAYCDFNGQVVLVHPVDGVYTVTSGWVVTNRSATVKGTCITPWQNKVWVGGDSSNLSRVWWSNAGDATTWTTASDFVDIRDVDGNSITAIGGGQGMDILGRAGVMVFKERSTYRIHDSTTGAYTTISAVVGAMGPEAVATVPGLTGFIGRDGFYVTDGIAIPRRVSQQIGVAFQQLGSNDPNDYVATVVRDHFFMFIPGTQTTCFYEYNPEKNWWMMHSQPMSDATLDGGFKSATRWINGRILALNSQTKAKVMALSATTGSIIGSIPFDAVYKVRLPWIDFDHFNQVRIRRMLVAGRSGGSNLTFNIYRDWSSTAESRTAFELVDSTTAHLDIHEVRSLGVARSISPEFYMSGDETEYLHSIATMPTPTNVQTLAVPAPYIHAVVYDFEQLAAGG